MIFRTSPHKSPVKDRREQIDRDKARERSPLGDKKKISAPALNNKAKSKEKRERYEITFISDISDRCDNFL